MGLSAIGCPKGDTTLHETEVSIYFNFPQKTVLHRSKLDLCNTLTNSVSFVFCCIAQAKLDLCNTVFCGKLKYLLSD